MQNFDTAMMKEEIAHLREEVSKLKDERQKWTSRRFEIFGFSFITT